MDLIVISTFCATKTQLLSQNTETQHSADFSRKTTETQHSLIVFQGQKNKMMEGGHINPPRKNTETQHSGFFSVREVSELPSFKQLVTGLGSVALEPNAARSSLTVRDDGEEVRIGSNLVPSLMSDTTIKLHFGAACAVVEGDYLGDVLG